jgi:hypothetical protein
MKEKPEPKMVSSRPLKLDRAMQIAAERAKHHPKMISMVSKVEDKKIEQQTKR